LCPIAADSSSAFAADLDREKLSKIDASVEAALKRNDCPGAVVVVVHADEIVFRRAYGFRAVQPEKTAMTPDTLFDMASLTKPMATATSIMILAEQGRLSFSDPVAKHWPAFRANGKNEVTIEHCLLHVSGLTADNPVADYADGRDTAFDRVAALKLEAPAAARFRYSDVGFIVLGLLVEKLGGMPVDQFAKRHVFDPLKMTDTGYKPPETLWPRVAPTGKRDGKLILGAVHDPRAFALGGVAGHAGLFSTADDLARYCRMLLRGGELDGVRVLKPETVRLFTEPKEVPAGMDAKDARKLYRSRGWDVETSYSAPRGDGFPRGEGFGHTGFTGTSAWVDPKSRTAVIVLTNRVHPDDKGNVTQLRREIGTVVAGAVKP
jgi:CubicO group peptidase (beta-lactamase class C family)